MAVYDDPVFMKALKLLHSPAKDSTMQIMHLLEEVMEQKYGTTKCLNAKLHVVTEELDVPRSKSSRGPSPALPGHSEKSSRSSTPHSEPVSSRTSPDRDDEDLALQIFEDDLFCTVCKGMRVTSDNRLLECNECHVLYHQECHKPPVDAESSDPRFVWTCGDCLSKQVKLKTSDVDSHSDSSSKKHKNDSDGSISEPAPKKRKSEPEKPEKPKKNDKAHSSKSHGSKSRSDSKKSSANSNLNFNKAPGSPNGKSPSCTANIIAADRRLQNMKKKAAAKMQEKRSNPK